MTASGLSSGLVRSVVGTSGARVLSLLLNLVTLTVTAHALGPTGRGSISIATTWALMVATFGSLSLGQVVIHRATSARADEQWMAVTMGTLLTAAAGVTLLGWVLLAAAWAATSGAVFGEVSTAVMLAGVAALPGLVWEQYGSFLLMARDRIGIYNRALLVGRVVGLLLTLLALGAGLGVVGALLALAVGQFVVAAGGTRSLLQESGRPRVDLADLWSTLLAGTKLHLNAVGAFFFSSADIVILGAFHGQGPAGRYQLAVQLVVVLLVAPQAMTNVLYGRVVVLGPDGVWSDQRRLTLLALAVSLLMALVLGAIAPVLIGVLAGDGFESSATLFRILLLTAPAGAINTLMGVQWISRGKFVTASLITCAAGATNIALNFLWVPGHGAVGAAWATVAGAFAIPCTINAWWAIRLERRYRRADAPTPR